MKLSDAFSSALEITLEARRVSPSFFISDRLGFNLISPHTASHSNVSTFPHRRHTDVLSNSVCGGAEFTTS
jgi:hypothetical protein